MNQRFIVIDGKTYKSVDEMPSEVRKLYEEAMRNLDKNQNGVPDAFEQKPDPQNGFNSMNAATIETNDQMAKVLDQLPPEFRAKYQQAMTKIIANGITYDNMDQLPPEIRAKYQKAMEAMDANKNGIPDFVEGMMNVSNPAPAISASASPLMPAKPTPISASVPMSSTIEPESTTNWTLVLAGIILVGACLVLLGAGAWYFFLAK